MSPPPGKLKRGSSCGFLSAGACAFWKGEGQTCFLVGGYREDLPTLSDHRKLSPGGMVPSFLCALTHCPPPKPTMGFAFSPSPTPKPLAGRWSKSPGVCSGRTAHVALNDHVASSLIRSSTSQVRLLGTSGE